VTLGLFGIVLAMWMIDRINGARLAVERHLVTLAGEAHIQEERAARTAAEAGAAMVSQLLEAAPDAILLYDLDGRILQANAQATVVFGYSRETLIGRPVEDLLPERFRSRHLEHRGRYVSAPRTRPMGTGLDLWAVHADGHEFPVEVSLSLMQAADGPRIVSIVRDVAEHRKAEVALRASEARFRALFEHSLDAVFLTVPDGTILAANPTACRMFGRSETELCALGRAGIVDAGDARLAPALAERERTGSVLAELTFIRANSSRFPDKMSSAVFTDASGRRCTSMVIRDVTERKLAEDDRAHLLAAKQAARVEVEQSLRMRDQFLSAVTHDLGQPLTSLSAAAQLLARGLGGDGQFDMDRLRRQVTLVQTAVVNMRAMVGDLVDLARLQVGQELDLVLGAADLIALVRAEVAAQQQATERHTIEMQAAVDELMVAIDHHRIARVVANLLANAIKYSPSGGPVTVTINRVEDGTRTWAELAVEDQGIGIPQADQQHIFERFYRASNVTGRFSGTGIGLSSARQIVTQHGGTLTLTSTEGIGTTVTVRLPAD
jgi:PAS domain S-box-containing protein